MIYFNPESWRWVVCKIPLLARTRQPLDQGAVYKGRPANGEGCGFEISDIPERREGVVCESSDVRKFLKKSKFQNFSEFFKVKTRNYNRSRFQYESIHI